MTPATIRLISAVEAFPMRRYLLRPMLAGKASRYQGDDFPLSFHLGAFADLGGGEELVGIVSFLPQNQEGEFDSRVYQLHGMVTLPAVRNEGIGTRLVEHGAALLRERHALEIWCNGRTPATPFYERMGFARVGEEFITPGTGPHYRFVRRLDS
jgi:GNAT superfamily N-acetyltransferase